MLWLDNRKEGQVCIGGDGAMEPWSTNQAGVRMFWAWQEKHLPPCYLLMVGGADSVTVSAAVSYVEVLADFQ